MRGITEDWSSCEPLMERKCESCKQLRLCAFIVDPEHLVMYNEPIERWLCVDCYDKMRDRGIE